MFYVSISHVRISVWTLRNMQHLKRGGWGRKLRGHVINTSYHAAAPVMVKIEGIILYYDSFIMENAKFAYILKIEHEISRVVKFLRLLLILLSGPFPYTFVLLCFRVMLVKKFEKQTLAMSLCSYLHHFTHCMFSL